jgi:hypothetical protein
MDLAVKAATECIVAYYAMDNPTGGALHVVTDDLNLSDRSIRFCLEGAEKEGDDVAAAIARLLLSLPLPERARAIAPRCCTTCGHSEALHFDNRETYGISCSGPCTLPDCNCVEAQVEPWPVEARA